MAGHDRPGRLGHLHHLAHLAGLLNERDGLSITFAALADPTRRAILARLAEGDANVGELAEPFSISQPAISRHLNVLERAGLISRGRAAQSRPSSLRVEPLEEATVWMQTRQQIWEGRMDRFDRAVQVLELARPDGASDRELRVP